MQASNSPAELRMTGTAPVAVPWRRLINGGVLVVLGTAAANGLSFLFSFLVARLLRPSDFATLTACLSILVVVVVPAVTLQLITARYTAIWGQSDPARAAQLISTLSRVAALLGVALTVAMVLASSVIARYLRLNDALPIVALAGLLLCSFLGPVCRGALQGQHRFGPFSIVTVSEYVIRLLAGLLLVVLGLKEVGALLGILCGTATAVGLGWWYLRPIARSINAAVPWGEVLRYAVPTLAVQAALSALVFQDTLLAKHFLPTAMAGQYAGLATTARVLVYASGAIGAFLFPVVARAHGKGSHGRLISHATLALVAAGELFLLAVYAAWPEHVILLVVGSQYTQVSGYVVWGALGPAAYAVLNVVVSYLLATDNRAFLPPLLFAPVLETVLVSLFHRNISDLVRCVDFIMLGTLAVMLWIYWQSRGEASAALSDA